MVGDLRQGAEAARIALDGDDPLRADRDAWAAAAAADSPEAYDRYLESYPRGIYSAAARERLARLKSAPDTSDSDREAWAAAAAADTVAAYMSYLGRFPSGQYAAIKASAKNLKKA